MRAATSPILQAYLIVAMFLGVVKGGHKWGNQGVQIDESCNCSSNATWHTDSTIKTAGPPLKIIPGVGSSHDCCSACTKYGSFCLAWVWQVSSLQCHLKNDSGTVASEAGHISALCNTPPSPPPAPPTPPPPTSPPGPPTKQPNIVFVLTDDQDALLNGYDPEHGVAHMDQLNTRVRANGALFTRYYLAYPLCSPSRSAILSGRYPHNTGFATNAELNSSLWHPMQEASTVNVWLQSAGYQTALVGKYMNGYHGGNGKWATYLPAGWTDWYGFQTVDFFGTQVNMNGTSTKFPADAYQTDIIANISLHWLRYNRDRTRPFFLMLTPHAPHEPYTPAPRHAGTLQGLAQRFDPAFNMATELQQLLPGRLGALPEVNNASMNNIFEKRAESLLAVDEMIGNLLDEIEAQNVMNNTFFFFSCDNGYHLGQHRLPPGKREIFQHDINVPLIVMGPGISPMSTISQIVMNIDMGLTWAELGTAVPDAAAPRPDGRSFAALLRNDGVLQDTSGVPWVARNYTLHEGYQSCEAGHGEGSACSHVADAFSEAPLASTSQANASSDVPDYSGLRLAMDAYPDAMYVEYRDGGKAFFNSTADPWQTRNLYSLLADEAKTELHTMLQAVVNCSGSACP
eukprot:m.694885 g.694885  ORF g.694885 m.694885 type:complete len:627 (+) comp22885_c1_seq7:239-2119(+)